MVVIDVVRATTSMVEALANGARAIYPTSSTEEAVKLASSLGRDDTLLCGERKGVKVEGFDLGNSPAEFGPEVVRDKRLVMSTTNGTVALVGAQEADGCSRAPSPTWAPWPTRCREEDDLIVLCAGRMGRFSLDDALCAGHLLQRLGVRAEEADNDAARAAWRSPGPSTPDPALPGADRSGPGPGGHRPGG